MIDQASLYVAASGLAILLSAPLRKLYRKKDKTRKTVLVTGFVLSSSSHILPRANAHTGAQAESVAPLL